ncbi:MAG: glycosyltransferase family 39 protein [Anaerolineae bacterium]|nr:glycosyltransferase family 39 protein [Anaerolineae bacterium]
MRATESLRPEINLEEAMEATAGLPYRTQAVDRSRTTVQTWQRVALVGILLLALFLHFFRLEQEGYANLYYAAAVKSMLTSWHNFFFNSFDPGGFVTVDKPPLGLWVQAASAALFGFSGTSLLLPQALAGVLSVWLLYHLARRVFGPTAGLIAALVLAVTPISVAANRNNTMDSLLVLVVLLAAWAVLRAVETGRLRWLLLCAALVGLGFNIKMLQAFLVLPAFYLLYLLASPIPWWKRLLHLALATAILLGISLSWVAAVDLTPPEERPYVGSSKDNTVMELIVGHNGLSRLLPGGLRALTGSGGQPAGRNVPAAPAGPPAGQLPAAPNNPPGQAPMQPLPGQPPRQRPPAGGQPLPPQPGQPAAGAARGGNGALSDETGEPGLLRLFNRQLAGQISWLLPLAGLGLVAAAWQTPLRFPLQRRQQSLLLWAVWLLPMIVFFSVANLFHRYYLEMMAPAIAALVAAGVVAMWDDYRRPGWRGWLLPLSLVGSAAVAAGILAEFPAWSRWLTPLVAGGCGLAALGLAAARLVPAWRQRSWPRLLAAAGTLTLLVPMLTWSLIPVLYGGHAGLPYAGPDLLQAPRDGNELEAGAWVDYLLANQGDAVYLAATLNARSAAPLILATGEPVMALGGFSGGDPILTVEEMAGRVAAGEVRFFLLSAADGQQRDLVRWVTGQCTAVPPTAWQANRGGRGEQVQLYDCGEIQ